MTVNRRRWKKRVTDEMKLAGKAPNEAITKEQWELLGYGADGHQRRPLTDDAIGQHKHPRPGAGTGEM